MVNQTSSGKKKPQDLYTFLKQYSVGSKLDQPPYDIFNLSSGDTKLLYSLVFKEYPFLRSLSNIMQISSFDFREGILTYVRFTLWTEDMKHIMKHMGSFSLSLSGKEVVLSSDSDEILKLKSVYDILGEV